VPLLRLSKNYSFRPIIFHFFPSCEKVSNRIFPNGYIDFLNSEGPHALNTYLELQQRFSLYSFLSKQTQSPNYQNDVFVSIKGIENKLKYCHRLVPIWESDTALLHYCRQDIRLPYHLKIHFNLSITSDSKNLSLSSGRLLNIPINLVKDNYFQFMFVTFAEVIDYASYTFIYCLPNNAPLLLTMSAFASPFDLSTWIALFFTLILLLFVRLQSKKETDWIEKVLFKFGLLLEQSLPTFSSRGVLACFSFFVLTAIYKTIVTCDLVVPPRVYNVNNLSLLVQKGYKMGYPRGLSVNCNFKKCTF